MDITNKYIIAIKKIKKLNESAYIEESHMLQDKLYRQFIRDIAKNRFENYDTLKHIARLIKKYVVKYDKEQNRWYA
jgi:hypothetical protein